jgi:glycosyltransferase involved in cell wall biosynthesis
VNDRRKISVRWATWWPVPYWVERYNALAGRKDLDLDVVFLSAESQLLPARPETRDWQFKYQIVRKEKAVSGYAKVNCRTPIPWPIVRGNFDLLIMPYGDPDFFSAAFLCALLKKRVCIFSPNHLGETRSFSLFREKLKQFAYVMATGVMATGTRQAQYAGRYVRHQEKIHIIGNPAPELSGLKNLCITSSRDEVRDELGWRSQLILLYVGRLSPEKDLDTLLDSMEHLSARKIPVKAVFVGTGPCYLALKARAESRNLNVEFTGFLEGLPLTRRYYAADVFVLPSVSEAWGLAVNEAMEAGLPVVVSHRVGSHPALVHSGKNGFVFQAGHALRLTEKLVLLHENPEIRKKMSHTSLNMIRRHTISGWVEQVTEAVHKMTVNQ